MATFDRSSTDEMKRIAAKGFRAPVDDWVDEEIALLHAAVAEPVVDTATASPTGRSAVRRVAAALPARLRWTRRPTVRLRSRPIAIVWETAFVWYALALALSLLAAWVVVAVFGNA